jgi:hypothetical protein
MDLRKWFDNSGGFSPAHDLDVLKQGIRAGLLDEQDEYGCTALLLAVVSCWRAGVEKLLEAGADTELRYFRTGATALYEAALDKRAHAMISLLLAVRADPDAPNYWGVTPRSWMPDVFKSVPVRQTPHPEPRIQNAEHLADHHHPRFKIPGEAERVSLARGCAIVLYVYGPKDIGKQDTVKVRIISRRGVGRSTQYVGEIETPLEQTHLAEGTTIVEFGPENIATVYVPKT